MNFPVKKYTSIALVSGVTLSLFAGMSYLTRGDRATADYSLQTSILQKPGVATTEALPIVIGSVARNYGTIDELVADSQVIVLGKFQGNPNVVRPKMGQDLALNSTENASPPQRDPDTQLKLLAERDPGRRELDFRPTEVLKGDIQASSITVAQRAVIGGNTVGQVADDKLFEPGETYILFLTPALSHEGKFYWITGAIQGAFKVENGRVNSRSVTRENKQEDIGPKVKGETLENFLVTIKEKVNSK
jgi:hypothetical protein